ncbi:MAG: hypothetical protein ABI422_03755 [Sphingomicrobium sp.]
MSRYLIVAAALAMVGGSASAKQPIPAQVPPPLQRLLACRSQSDGAARLACFDRESGAAAQGFASGDIVAVDREKIRSTKRTLFGLSIPNLGIFGDDESELKQVEGVLSGAGFNRDGGYIFRLQDGARWSQTDSKPIAIAPRAGDKVVVKRGAMGSYFLSIGHQPGVKVQRLN